MPEHDDYLPREVKDQLAFAYGVDSANKAKMVEAFVKDPKQKPFSSFLSIKVSQGAFANVYRHAFYPASIIRLSTPWSGDPKVSRAVKMNSNGHSHYMEQWIIPNQGNRYTPKVDMYVRLATGETLAIMERLLPPDSTHMGYRDVHIDEEIALSRLTDKRLTSVKLKSIISKDLLPLFLFLQNAAGTFRTDLALRYGRAPNILMRKCGQMVVVDPLV